MKKNKIQYIERNRVHQTLSAAKRFCLLPRANNMV